MVIISHSIKIALNFIYIKKMLNNFMLINFALFIPVITQTLKQIQVIYRHGARNQLYDNWNTDAYKDRLGLLTSVGYRQHFQLGSWLRENYVDTGFLSQTLNLSELLILSTDVNRTLMSATLNLYGMYPLGTGPTLPAKNDPKYLPPNPGSDQFAFINENATLLGYQPVPINTKDISQDWELASWDDTACPRYQLEQQQNMQSLIYKQVVNFTEPYRKAFSQFMNLSSTVSLEQYADYADTFIANLYNDQPLPENLQNLQFMIDVFSLQMHLQYFENTQFTRTLTTPFFQRFLKYSLNSSLKAIVYSAHDTTIMGLMDTLNLTSSLCKYQALKNETINLPNCIYSHPGFASSLIFEIYQELNESLSVKLKMNGTYVPICGASSCPLEDLQSRLERDFGDYEHECFEILKQKTISKGILTSIITSIVISVVFIGFGLYMLKQSYKPRRRRVSLFPKD